MRIGKNTIRLITGIMSLALLGLLGLQWYWVDSALQLKEKEFDLQVANALDRVADRLQDLELLVGVNEEIQGQVIVEKEHTTRHIRNGQRIEESSIVIRNDLDSTSSPNNRQVTAYAYQFKSDGDTIRLQTQGKAPMLVVEGGQQVIVTQNIHGPTSKSESGYVTSVVRRILQAPKPIHERVTPGRIDSLLREELNLRGITDTFSFRIDSRPKIALPASMAAWTPAEADHQVLLFPHDLPPSRDFLLLDFPERAGGLMQALGLMLPTSAVLALILVACFAVTLMLLGRQRRQSEMQRDFIHNMSHELKTPLATISLAVQALDDPDMRAAGKTDAYLGIIRAENARMQEQVARVLEAAASARGELPLTLTRIDLGPLLQAELDRMALLLEARGGLLEGEGGSGFFLQGDPIHLSSILRNLLENAEKYSPTAPHITVRLQREGGQLVLSVQDRGIGMGPAEQRRVFEPFYRAHTGNVHDVKGFGLGLSYVKAMVEAHGGSVRLTSQAGRGTTFWLQFPAVP